MDAQALDRIVGSVLYEGYLLYPYRQSLKNIKRWTFGCLYPTWSSEVAYSSERSGSRARCLVVGDPGTQVSAEVRFLQLVERRTETETQPSTGWWHECLERRIACKPMSLGELLAGRHQESFALMGEESESAVVDATDEQLGHVTRRQAPLAGLIEIGVEPSRSSAYRLTVSVANQSAARSEPPSALSDTLASGLLQAMASAHVVLQVQGGKFISRMDPPEEYRDLLVADPTDGLWPVLVGDEAEQNTMLCSPIILYDYPQIAPESPGDFFDGTEIDEMLTLRILTLTDEEKRNMAALDVRGRALLERTQGLAERQLANLHGTMRSVREIREEPHAIR